MKLKHTPAPWIFDDIEMKIKGTGDIEGRTVIANVSPKMNYSRGMMTQTANAKLIAAAPNLLKACLTAKAMYEAQGITPDSRIGGEQFSELLDAIRRVTV